MRLIDTHSHLHDAEFDGDRDDAIERARAAGVELIVALGVDEANSHLAVSLAERHPTIVVAAVGVHPHEARDTSPDQLDEMERMAEASAVAMIGEIGLDFYRNLSSRDEQLYAFRRQLETASRVGKPVAIHARDALDEMVPLVEAWSHKMGGCLPDGRPLGVMHYFSGDGSLAGRCADLGFLISVHTSVTHPKATLLGEVVREISLDHLVLETDSPYGAPQRYRGKRNEPAYVGEAAGAVAALKGVAIEEVAERTTRNAVRLLTTSESRGSAEADAHGRASVGGPRPAASSLIGTMP